MATKGETPLLPVIKPSESVRPSYTARKLDVSDVYRCAAAVHPAWTGLLLVLFQLLALGMSISLLVAAKQQNNLAFFYGGITILVLQTIGLLTVGVGGLTNPFIEFMDIRPKKDSAPSAAAVAALHDLIARKEAPKVDLFITCCREPLDVIQDTVLASMSQDYPSGYYTVYVLDDGGDDNLKRWVEETSRGSEAEFPKLVYIRRPKQPGVCSNYKAGNLNHALKLTTAPFVAQLDADMIPTPGFLATVLAAMMEDPRAGFAFCTQSFYNWGPSDVLDDHQVQLWMVSYTRMTHLGVGPNAGSGVIWKRAALDATGGFRTDSQGEDFLTSWDVITRGYTSVYCRELLQCGLVPWTLGGWYRQHRRWNTSSCEYFGCIGRQMLASPHLTLKQKYGMTGAILSAWMQPVLLLVGQWLLGISMLLLSCFPSMYIQDALALRWMLFLGLLANITQVCHGLLLYKATPSPVEQYLRAGFRSRFENTWAAVWAARYFLGINNEWKATGSKLGGNLLQQLQFAWPHLLTVLLWLVASVRLLTKNLKCHTSVVLLAINANLLLITLASLPEILLPVWYYTYGAPKPSQRRSMVPRDPGGVPVLDPAAVWPQRDWRVVLVMGLQPAALMMGMITAAVVCVWAPVGASLTLPCLC